MVKRFFSSSKFYTDSGFHPTSYSIPKVLSLRAKRVGREADHSPPSSAEFKAERSYTSSPPICLIACTGIIVILFLTSQAHGDADMMAH